MFEATARLGSFARAAEQLCVTESAVCRQVVQLEDRMNVALFLRSKKRLILTSEGARYAAEVRAGLQSLSGATEGLVGRARGKAVVELATVPAFATQWLIPRMHAFTDAHPDVQLNVFARVDPVDLSTSKFDMVIYSGWEPAAGYPSCRIVSEGPSVVVCAPALSARIPAGDWDALLSVGLVHLESRPEAWSAFMALRGIQRSEAMLGHRFEMFTMVIRAVVGGMGIALIPRIMAEEQLRQGTLVELTWCQPTASDKAAGEPCAYYASWKPGAKAAAQKLADWLTNLA